METSSGMRTAAAVASTAVLVAGVGYVLYKYVLAPSLEEEEEAPAELPASMQSLLTGGAASSSAKPRATSPALPVRKTPPPPTAGAVAAKPRGGAPTLPARKPNGAPAAKACARCAQPLKAGPQAGGALPQRCGQCKAAYYCSSACQKKHWPEHKPLCTKGAADKQAPPEADAAAAAEAPPPLDAGAGPASPEPAARAASGVAIDAGSEGAAASSPAAAVEAAEPESSGDAAADVAAAPAAAPAAPAAAAAGEVAGPSTSSGSAAAGGSGPAAAAQGGLQGALVEVLRQAAEEQAGTLDGAFEEAVMFFLGGKLPTALTAFTQLQVSARAAGRADLVQELHKWVGHTNTRLGNFGPAADAFKAGITAAKAAGNTAARVDNAIGLGNLWKMAGQLTEATTVLKEALLVAQDAGSAGMQSEVLVALGNAVLAAEPEEGLACLQIAVKLREDEVGKAAESGDRAGIATGMMQAAAGLVNMAAALFATLRFKQAREAYEQAMEIFELMEDHDKVVQVLVNLANLAELQLDEPEAALDYRLKLAAALKQAGHPGIAGGAPAPSCAICKKPIALKKARARGDAGAAMVLLACLHVQHDACFKEWCDAGAESAGAVAAAAGAAASGEVGVAAVEAAASPGAKRTTTCPTCAAPVPIMT